MPVACPAARATATVVPPVPHPTPSTACAPALGGGLGQQVFEWLEQLIEESTGHPPRHCRLCRSTAPVWESFGRAGGIHAGLLVGSGFL